MKKNIQNAVVVLFVLCGIVNFCFAANLPSQPTLAKKKSISLKKTSTKKQTHHSKKTNKTRYKKLAHKKNHPYPHRNKLNSSPVLSNQQVNSHSLGFLSSFKQHLIHFIENTMTSLHYSAYQLGGTHFDSSRGIYILDCSSYVDRILQATHPQAYSKLTATTGSDKPTTHDYYDFFTHLSDEPAHYWDKIDTIEQLEPGDLIVFRYKNKVGNEIGGHIMMVMEKPLLNTNSKSYYVRVTDSAPSAHSQDTRTSHTSGIGIGTLVLKVNPKTYQPYAYAWKIGSRWKYNVNFAMGRPGSAIS